MSRPQICLLFTLVTILVTFQSANALKCYQCLACSSPFKDLKSVECPVGECYSGSYKKDDINVYNKGCIPKCIKGKTKMGDIELENTCCDTDNCNSAADIFNFMNLALALVAACSSIVLQKCL